MGTGRVLGNFVGDGARPSLGQRVSLLLRDEIADSRQKRASWAPDRWWATARDREPRRLLTTVNNATLRKEFCRCWEQEYSGDLDNGCPADRPPPATIVTAQGDVPLIGPWPR